MVVTNRYAITQPVNLNWIWRSDRLTWQSKRSVLCYVSILRLLDKGWKAYKENSRAWWLRSTKTRLQCHFWFTFNPDGDRVRLHHHVADAEPTAVLTSICPLHLGNAVTHFKMSPRKLKQFNSTLKIEVKCSLKPYKHPERNVGPKQVLLSLPHRLVWIFPSAFPLHVYSIAFYFVEKYQYDKSNRKKEQWQQ